MKTGKRRLLFMFLTPALLAYGFIFVYPTLQTLYLSFFNATQLTGGDNMPFTGLENYIELYYSPVFRQSFINIGMVWLVGGLGIFGLAFLFTALITSGIRGKAFFRAVIYLPNLIPVTAATAMWVQYVYNPRFGLFKTFFNAIGLHDLANIQWTASDMIFWAMLIAYVWGGVGFFMLIILAGFERIPFDLLEAAKLDGANTAQTFFNITLPLLRDVIRITLVMWSITAINLFSFPKTFSPVIQPNQTMTPAIYLYNLAFGQTAGNGVGGAGGLYVGKAAAVGVILTILVLIIYLLINIVYKEDKLEY